MCLRQRGVAELFTRCLALSRFCVQEDAAQVFGFLGGLASAQSQAVEDHW